VTRAFLTNVFRRTLYDQRRALLGYGIGIAALVAFTGALYPTVRDQAEQFKQLAQALPQSVQAFVGDLSDLTSAAGYLRGRLFALTLPALFLVYAITKGSDVIGGEEDRGTLDVLLAQPITRPKVFLHKAAGVATGLGALTLVVLAGVVAIDVAFGMGVGLGRIAAASLDLLLLALAHAGIAFGLTGLGLRRGAAASAAAAVAFAGFLFNAFANLADVLEPLRFVSPFSYYAEPDSIKNGADVPAMAVLAGLAVVSAAVGLVQFRRRDIAV
jgi:beta-exotoxin I transport system permease protein